jgi:hypothetical protein
MAISREPLPAIPPAQVEKDRRFWSERLGQMLGDWLKPETSVKEVCAFAERVFLRKDLAGGEYVRVGRRDYIPAAQVYRRRSCTPDSWQCSTTDPSGT